MTDFLIQAHKAPSHRVTKPKVALTDTKVDVRPTKLGSEHSLRKAISNTLRDANNAILSWKDGLTVQERDLVRTRAERKSLLFARMKKVRWSSELSIAMNIASCPANMSHPGRIICTMEIKCFGT